MNITPAKNSRAGKLRQFSDMINEKIRDAELNGRDEFQFDIPADEEDWLMVDEIISSLQDNGYRCSTEEVYSRGLKIETIVKCHID